MASSSSSYTLVGLTYGLGLLACACGAASLAVAFLSLVVHFEHRPGAADSLLKRVSLANIAILFALVCSRESLPRSYLVLALGNNVLALFSSCRRPRRRHDAGTRNNTSPSTGGLPITLAVVVDLAACLILPLLTHFTLLSHVSSLHATWHTYRTAPRLPGGRLDWDVPVPTRQEYTGAEIASLLVVGAWGSAVLLGLRSLARVGWVGEAIGQGSLPAVVVASGRSGDRRRDDRIDQRHHR